MTAGKPSFLSRLLRKLFWWIVLPVGVIFLVSLIWNPEDKLFTSMFNQIREESGVSITYASVSISPLMIVHFSNLQVTREPLTPKGKPEVLFYADNLDIYVAFAEILKGRLGFDYTATAFGGTIKGVFSSPLNPETRKAHFSARWTNISLAVMKKTYTELPISKGIASGDADIFFFPEKPLSNQGVINIRMTGIDFSLPDGQLDAYGITGLDRIEGKLRLDNAFIHVDSLQAFSTYGDIAVSGDIQQDIILENSRLNLDLRIYSHLPGESPDPKQYIPLKILGTLEKPRFEFLGIDLSSKDLFHL